MTIFQSIDIQQNNRDTMQFRCEQKGAILGLWHSPMFFWLAQGFFDVVLADFPEEFKGKNWLNI